VRINQIQSKIQYYFVNVDILDISDSICYSNFINVPIKKQTLLSEPFLFHIHFTKTSTMIFMMIKYLQNLES